MSGPVYTRFPGLPPPASSRGRAPFSNSTNRQQAAQAVHPAAPALALQQGHARERDYESAGAAHQQLKKSAAAPKFTLPVASPPRPTTTTVPATAKTPPLPRQNTKEPPPTPPPVIVDAQTSSKYVRVGFLGEGGFARVYEVKDPHAERIACKVIHKQALKSKKAKTKLYAEIKIHSSLSHPNIVGFRECFEDRDNVYLTLDLCPNGSLMDLLRRRRRFTEPETRFFLMQLLGACHFMHSHQVIHRDLKLGNLFLDQGMNIKVGDFGLAALIEVEGERKKTICGTPNYIAPEVLFDQANGHSFEVDTWSIGVILYTLIIGRPPFQTKDVKDIYKRIEQNAYEFPPDRSISFEARELITEILTPTPSERPSLHTIADDRFLTRGIVPSFLPSTVLDSIPDWRHITRSMSQSNYARLRKAVRLDEDFMASINVSLTRSQRAAGGQVPTIAQQELEFNQAVQPGSPISALLSSARKPLVVSTNGGGGGGERARESPLIRKLQAASKEPRGSPLRQPPLQNIDEEDGDGHYGPGASGKAKDTRWRELESQKARIVAQMAGDEPEGDEMENVSPHDAEERKVKPKPSKIGQPLGLNTNSATATNTTEGRPRSTLGVSSTHNRLALTGSTNSNTTNGQSKRALHKTTSALTIKTSTTTAPGPSHIPAPAHITPAHTALATSPSAVRLHGFDAAASILAAAFDARKEGKTFYDPDEPALEPAKVFIASWVDYCHKYGMGYALTDGSVGVYFNDSTSLVLSPDKEHIDYISSRAKGTVYVRKHYMVSDYPQELKSKVYLLKHFEGYIVGKLLGEYTYLFNDDERTKNMDFVQKFLRMKHVVVFKMSHNVLQFNFQDHCKIVLAHNGLHITFVDKHYRCTHWTLSDVMARSLGASLDGHAVQPEEHRFILKLVDKLKYCKEVLQGIISAATEDGVESEI